MQVQIAGERVAHLPAARPLLKGHTVADFAAGQDRRDLRGKIRVVKLMPAQGFAGRRQQRLPHRPRLAVAKAGKPFAHLAVAGNQIGHRIDVAAGVFKGAAEIHQTAALGVNRHPAPVRLPQLRQHRRIGRQPDGMNFRIAAAEPNHLARRKLAIAQRAEAHDIHPAALKQRKVIRVVKVEGFVVGQRQRQARAGVGRRQRGPLPGG